jgi:hypothetical protein
MSPTAARTSAPRLETAGSARPILSEPRGARWPLVAGGAVVFAGAVVAAFLLLRPPEETATARLPPPVTEPRPAPVVATESTDVVKTEEVETRKVSITITSDPAGADVYRMPSETKVGTTPYSDQIDRADGTAVFVLRKPRHADATVELDQRTGGVVDQRLVREPKSKRPVRDKKPGGRRKGEPIDPFDKGPK